MNHPTPSHSPNTNVKLAKWASVARRSDGRNSPSIADSLKNWRTPTAQCNCSLSIRPMPPLKPIKGTLDIPTILHYAHQYGDFARAHDDFERSKDEWTPAMFGKVLQLIHDAKCIAMDTPLRAFHQAIRNNGLWTYWIQAAAPYPRFEAILLEELAAVIENLSPKYLKDIRIEHLLKIFPAADGRQDVHLHGKKRKLKRQVLKWCETQTEEVLNNEWANINTLKWRLQSVIDTKDREMEERQRMKSQNYHHNWRSNSSSPVSYQSRHSTNTSPKPITLVQAATPTTPRFTLSDTSNWPSLKANWTTTPNQNQLVLGV